MDTLLLLTLASGSVCLWLLLSFFKSTLSPAFQDIRGPPSKSFLTGNVNELFSADGLENHVKWWAEYGRVFATHGLFGTRDLYVSDPLALHHITVKDQDVYEETSAFIQGNRLLMGQGLLGTLGDQHRRQRKILNPVFSINHMRNMLPIFYKVTHDLKNVLMSQVADGPKELDMLLYMSRAALELIGQGGLGYSLESFKKESANPFTLAMKKLQPTWSHMMVHRLTLPYLVNIGPSFFRRWLVSIIPSKNIQQMKEIVDIIDRTTKEVYHSKKAALTAGDKQLALEVAEGKDIMTVLLRANMSQEEKSRLSEEELIAQMSNLTAAAFDTTSSALARILHLLSHNPEIQQKLRAELTAAHDTYGELGYDELHTLPYLEAICRETLRVYAPVTQIRRTSRKNMILPLSSPIIDRNGNEISSVYVPDGAMVTVGIAAINRDTVIWGDDAHEWKPDRWLKPLPKSVMDARVPGVYANTMTFLAGSRSCIGFKFSQMEMKVVMSLLIEAFSFAPAKAEVEWNLGGISYPTIAGTRKASMPLIVTALK